MSLPFPSICYRLFAAVISFVLLCGTLFLAQTPQQQSSSPELALHNDPEPQHVTDLYNAGKFVEAMPLFEKLVADHPDDATIKADWAFSILAYAATLTDLELRKKARVRARSVALQAQELGNNNATVELTLQTPPDGSESAFSDRKEVDVVMKAAEADFVRGDLDKARNGYLRAALLNPNNYPAALFIGDVYFKQHVNGSAGEWFDRAIQIAPNRETAYRYWGDALWDMGKSAEARQKYIEAIIAEPYSRMSRAGLTQWAQRSKMPLNWVILHDKGSVVQKDEKNISITLDSSLGKDDPNGSAWLTYSLGRATWRGDKFK